MTKIKSDKAGPPLWWKIADNEARIGSVFVLAHVALSMGSINGIMALYGTKAKTYVSCVI